MKKPASSAKQLEAVLKHDAQQLPPCPSELHAEIMNQVRQGDPGIDTESISYTRPVLLSLAAMLVVGVVSYSVLNNKETPASDEAPLAALQTLPQISVTQLAGGIQTAVKTPYENELKHIGSDVEAATRFLLLQLNNAVPVSVAKPPQG
jgi:hypothetical protein